MCLKGGNRWLCLGTFCLRLISNILPGSLLFLKHRYLRETKRSTSFSCLYFNLDVLAKNSPSSDVTGDFCSSSLRRKSLALDECIFGLRLENEYTGCWRGKSHWLSQKSLSECHSLSEYFPSGKWRKNTHVHTSVALIICLSLTLIRL